MLSCHQFSSNSQFGKTSNEDKNSGAYVQSNWKECISCELIDLVNSFDLKMVGV